MNHSQLAPRANPGGALPRRCSAYIENLGLFARWVRSKIGAPLRKLMMTGACLITAIHAPGAPSVTLAWDANVEPDIARYELSYGVSSGIYSSTVDAGLSTIIEVGGLTEGQTYYFVVCAYSTAGIKSLPSSQVSYTVPLNETPPNAVPSAIAQTVSAAEDTPLNINLTGTDAEGATLNYTVTTPPRNGTLIGAAPNLTYVPAANFSGDDSFTFQVNDGTLNSEAATVAITVTAVNDAPLATAGSVTTGEDSSLPITLGGTDPDADSLTVSIVAAPAHGKLTGTAPNFTYSPVADYNGVDSLTFRVNDGTVTSATATLSIAVTAVNDAPLATAKTMTTAEDTSATISLTGTDPDGDNLIFSVVTAPAHGTLAGTAPDLTYSPAANYNGADSFTFRVNDGTVNSTTATVSIAVTTAPSGAWTLHYVDSQQSQTYEGAAAFDGDSNTFWHTAWSGNPTPPPHEIQINLGASESISGFRYLPRQDTRLVGNVGQFEFYVSPDGVNWGNPVAAGVFPNTRELKEIRFGKISARFIRLRGLSDANGGIYMTVAELEVIQDSQPSVTNQAPLALSKAIYTEEDTAAEIALQATDADGNTLRFSVVSAPTKGSLSGTPPSLIYTPSPNYTGADSFTFRVNDGTVNSATATVSITVTAANDPPVAIAKAVVTAEDNSLPISLTGTDPDGDSLTFAVVAAPAHGKLTGTAPNLTYSPAANYTGADQFTFRVNDGTVNSAIATVFITVTAVNSLPVFIVNLIPFTATKDQSFTGQLRAFDADPGDVLTFQKVGGPAWLNISADGKLDGTPLHADVGTASFIVKASDRLNAYATTTLTITVANTNDAPVFADKPLLFPAGAENEPYAQSLANTATDSDPSDTITYSKIDGPAWLVIGKSGELSGTPPGGSAGINSFTVRATDSAGATDDTTLQIEINTDDLPLPWNLDRVGNSNLAGAGTFDSGIFTVAGAGRLADKQDSGTFVWQTLTGDGNITARISKLRNPRNGSRVGVVIRESLAANSRQTHIGIDARGKYQWLRRSSTAGGIYKTTKRGSATNNVWLRLVRKGTTITAYRSINGIAWTKMGSSSMAMAKNCYIGLSVSSGSDTLLTTSLFDKVEVTP